MIRAVQAVNTALPVHWKLRVLSDTPASTEVMEERGPYITVDFISGAEWRALGLPPAGGVANVQTPHYSHVYLSASENFRLRLHEDESVKVSVISVVAHELLHALGHKGHVNSGPGWDSIMTGLGSKPILQLDEAQPLSVLYPIDREALRVLYDRLNRGDMAAYEPRPLPLPKPQTTRGNFTVTYQNVRDTVFRVLVASKLVYLQSSGGLDIYSFYGSRGLNPDPYFIDPYTIPSPPLTDNPALQGQVSWRGVLAGFSVQGAQNREFDSYFPPGTKYEAGWVDQLVLGDAELSLNFNDLSGLAVFSNLETWDPGQPPGGVGTGRKWANGNIRIPITVDDNRVSGREDNATLDGSFLGPEHEVLSGFLSYYETESHPLPRAVFGGVRDGVLDSKPVDAESVDTESVDTERDMTDFGPWTSESLHVTGNGEHVGFGTASRNGYGEPWAHGYAPETDLVDNPTLAGTVTWNGSLVGFTPEASVVAGDAKVLVSLDELNGVATFDNLKSWARGIPPSENGMGETWGDGNLRYGLTITGNTFKQSGVGDSGVLTGIFVGASHEAVGGTLVREDLSAAFGGGR